jgi:DNA polymerase-3 subunit epsilon
MLTLAKCRERYHLPSYSNHNALSDAMATAELLLAQITAMGSGSNILLSQLVVNQP